MEILDLTIAQLIPLLVFQLLLTIGYGAYLSLKDIPLPLPSLSESYYQLKLSNSHHMFVLYMSLLGVPFLLYQSPWFFIAGVMFIGTGVTIKGKDIVPLTDDLHSTMAITGIGACLIGLLSWGVLWPPLLMVILTLTLFLYGGKHTLWWIEIGAICCIGAGIVEKMMRMLG